MSDQHLLTSMDFAKAFAHLGRRRLERVLVVGTDNEGNVLGAWESSSGTSKQVAVCPLDTLQACTPGVTRVCVMHNHPSKNTTPSEGDVKFTKCVAAMYHKVGIHMVDHLIIGHGGAFFSFKEATHAGLSGACTVHYLDKEKA